MIQQRQAASDFRFDVRFSEETPSQFVLRHSDEFRRSVILRVTSSTKEWPVKLTIAFPTPRSTHATICGGWRQHQANEMLIYVG